MSSFINPGTAKSASKFDKYENKSEVLQYKAAADTTMSSSTKRKLDIKEEEEEEKPKKIKVGGAQTALNKGF